MLNVLVKLKKLIINLKFQKVKREKSRHALVIISMEQLERVTIGKEQRLKQEHGRPFNYNDCTWVVD